MRQDVTFTSNGKRIVGELHLPGETASRERVPGVVVVGPASSVKGQVPTIYAERLAELYQQDEAADHRVVDAVGAIAAEREISRTQVALAWLLHQPAVTAPIVGVTKPEHLADAVAAVDVALSDDELARLPEPYTPRRPERL